MASDGLTLETLGAAITGGWNTVTTAATDGWNAVSTAVTGAVDTVTETATKAYDVAHAVITQTTLEEEEGVYTINGPFASKFTFSWREIIMLGGLVSSVIFATVAFFSGSVLTGLTYLVYTGLLTFGAYWLSEWSKNLKIEQILDIARAGGAATLEVLQTVVGQIAEVFEGHGEANEAHALELRTLQGKLDGNVEELGEQVKAIPATMAPVVGEFGRVIQLGQGALEEREARCQRAEAQLRDRLAELATANRTLGELTGEMRALRTIREQMEASGTRIDAGTQRLFAQLERFEAGLGLASEHLAIADAGRHVHFEVDPSVMQQGHGRAVRAGGVE